MKTIIYAFIAIFVFGIMQPAFTNKAPKQNSILIQATDSKATDQQLAQAAKIISARLTDFSQEKSEVTVISEKHQILVSIGNIQDLKPVENLLTHKGILAFYETYSRSDLSGFLKDDKQLFSMLSDNDTHPADAKIGCTNAVGVKKINEYLKVAVLPKDCQFLWDQPFEEPELCLYALKTIGDKRSLITCSDIESVTSNQEKGSLVQEISITLKKSAVESWADATKRNLNHAIAIVLDGQVLAAPVLRSVITGGKCSITGNYTPTQARYIAAIGNNGMLPLSFKIIQ